MSPSARGQCNRNMQPLMSNILPEALHKTREVAAALGVHPDTLAAWVRRGLLPAPTRIGGRNFWPDSAVKSLMAGGGAPDNKPTREAMT